MATLFCGNLAWTVTDEELLGHVNSLGLKGVTEAQVSMRGDRSKGWGLVKFDNEANCTEALALLNDSELSGRAIRAREDRAPEDRPRAQRTPRTPRETPERAPAPTRSVVMEAATPSDTLYVGNLPWEVTSEDLLKTFREFRPTLAEVHKRLSGRSKGFATVKFANIQDAEACMNKFNEQDMSGRPLKIKFDREKQSDPSNKLFVGNLPWSADDEAVGAMFSEFRVLEASVKVVGHRSRGFAILTLADQNEAKRVLDSKAEFEYEGRTIFCRFDRR